ncbi:MAG: isopeptide-forming domain-containing fimbrial protein, partial [Verrucomicrobiales bacterium]
MQKSPSAASPRFPLAFEALESRVLYDAVADVKVSVVEEQFINEDVTFQIDFDNTGDATGYAPYVDFIAPPELAIKGVVVAGAPALNPDGSSVTPIGQIAADGQLVGITSGLPVDHPMFKNPSDGGSYGLAGSATAPVLYDTAGNPDLVGMYVYSVQLPFGSFTEGNPPASVSVTTSLDKSNGIIPHQEVVAYAQGGFAYGSDALHNPATDFPIASGLDSDGVTPLVIDLNKDASVPEMDGPYTGENASGPNHQITYSLTVRLADGEEVNNLVIQDFLPDDLAFSGNLTVTFGSGTGGSKNLSIEDEPELNTDGVTGTDPANNRLRLTVDNIIGSGGNDITVTYTAFVPYKEADGTLVVNAVTGEQNDLADDEYNDASVTADYDRDGAGPAPTLVIGDDEGPMNPFTTLQSFDSDTDFRIEEHSIATQKDVAIAPGGDRGVIGTLNSSDVLEYTINFQISDYFAFTDVVFDDVMGDGQEFLPALDPSSTWFNAGDFSQDPEEIRPEVTFTMHGASITVAFDEANFSAIEHPDGSTSIHFNVYQQLVDSGFLVSGDPMLGGFIAPSGTAPADLGPLNFDGGPTTGTIRYRALTRESFTTGGQPQISQGDSLSNTVVVTGLNRDIETFAPLVDVTDDSSSSIDIPVGIPVKETVNIYSHGQMISLVDDNDESTPPAVAVAPGDLITYRILYTLPISEYENLKFTDFLPMPIFDVDGPGSLALDTSGIYSYDPVATYQTPGRISYGPNGTFFGGDGPGGSQGIEFDNPGYNSTAGITPVITVDDHLNSFTIDFGDYDLGDGNEAVATTIELFITMQVKDAQFADGLFFTNQILVDESSTIGSQSSTNEISQNILSTPELAITKGIAAVTHDDGVFSAATGPAGIVFTPPGSATAWTGANINSTALAATPIDANLSNVDAGDLITFVIVVENTGTSSWGAFDVSINDTIPAGLTIPGGGANLRVTDGNGNPMAYTGDLFTTPLELTDPSQSQGSLTRYDATSGTNLVVIAYDLLVENSVTAAETLTNVAEVESYAASEGGADFADPGDLSDVASVTIALPATEKIILDTSHDDANNLDANREVAIGEVVTYQVSFTLPEGTLNNLRITDSLPTGMAFVGLDSVVLSSSDLSSTDGDVNDIVAFFNSGASTLELGYGTSGSPGLGSWLNSSTDNSVAETITITYRAVVLNAVSNDRDDTLTNAATLEWEVSGASQTVSDSESVVILEPDLMITKSVVGSITGVEGAQEITYLIRVENLVADPTHPNRSEAYNVRLSDLLPDDVSYVISALASGAAPDSGIDFDSLVGASGEISASWDRLAPGEFSEISVTVRIDDGLPTDTVITNNASVEYTSLPGSQGDSGFTGFDPGSIDPSLAFGTGALNANLNSSDPIFDSANERTGNPADDGGVANDYTASAPASVTVINPVGIDKAIIDTAEAHTSQDASTAGPVSAAIGEVVRFEVRVRLPQVASSQLQLVDTLDAGLFWIDASTNLLDIRLEGFSNPANLVASNALIPAADGLTHPLDASLVSYDSLNNQVTFNLGDFTNLETDAGDEFLIIGYNVIVRNDSGVARGDTLVNSVQLREGGFDLGSPFSSSLTVVEPVLTVAKSDGGVTTADAGDLINYTLTVTASNAANTTTAFELLITDSVPAALEIVGGVISISGLPGSSSVLRSTVSGQDISVLVDRLKPGETFQISYQARVRDAGADVIQAGETVLNTADLTYTSLPDDGTDNGSGDNTTGNEAGLPDTESGERIFSTSGSDGFTAVAPVLTKVLGNPADTAFTVGEAVEYVITLELPEGRTGNPMAYVLDTIDPGFRFLPGTLQVTVGSGIAVGTSGILDEVNTNFFTFTDPGDSALSELLRFDFGFIDFESGTAGDGLHKGTIEIRYQLQVENILAIQAGDSLNNTADLFYTNHDGVTTDLLSDTDDADTIITVVEPQVDVTKSIDNISSPDAGGIVSYRIVLDHPGDTIADFNTGAYDITITDTLPVDVAMQPGTFTAFLNGVTDVSSWFSVMATGFTDNGFGQIDLAPGDQIVVTYDATISVAVTDGELLINEVDIEWTSLDAGNLSDGIDAVDTGERTGSGTGPNDYAGSDTATVTANLTPAYSLTKAVVATTADHTGTAAGTNASMTDLVIGEMVTYQITAQMGRGTTNGVVIEDFLALTNGILDIRDVRIEYGSALTLTVPSAVISDSNTDSFKDQVSLTFGTVVNYPSGSSGPADEQIRIFVDAVVVNVSANQGGDVIANTGQLTVLEDTDNDGAADDIVVRTSSVSVEIVEPALTVDKMITSVPANPDAGDIVSYQIVVSNNSGVDAFEATFSDMVPAGLDLLTGTFAAVRTVGGADVTSWFTVTANSIDQIGTFNLATGDSITITYNAEILTTVTDGERLVNSATTTWTSLESADLTDGSDTGDTEERTGSGTGPNDYAESDTAMVTANLTPVYDFSKSVFSTSASHTGSAYGTDPSIEDLVIGETVTYQLTAQMGRGTTNGVVIEDLLALTNGLLDIRDVRIEIGAALTVTVPTPTLTDSNLDSYIDQVLLNFGTVVNDPTSSTGPADEQIRIFIDAVVVNVLQNQEGDVITNAASLTLLEDTDNDGSADDTVVRTDTVDVEIVEPVVSVAKSITSAPANPDAGDTVSYQIIVSNTGDIDAFDVTFADTLPAQMSLATGTFTAVRDSDGADMSAFFTVSASGIVEVAGGFDLA